MSPAELNRLLEKYTLETLTESEFDQLWDTLQQPEYRHQWENWMKTVWENEAWHQLSDEPIKEKVWARISQREGLEEGDEGQPGQRRRLYLLRGWWAAAIVLCLIGGAYLWSGRTMRPKVTVTAGQFVKNDVPPGGNKAVLILADGRQIVLDKAHQGSLTIQGNARVSKTGSGKLSYEAIRNGVGQTGGAAPSAVYNTLSTPRGGQYRLTLPDGTQVWLNAVSSITFPTSFSGGDRRVSISGEAYFEVTAKPGRPFIVRLSGRQAPGGGDDRMEVEVLGTRFNINAYSDEAAVKTTLLEGTVKITNGTANSVLKPGEQAQVSIANKLTVVDNMDVEEAVAWKNGYYKYSSADIQTLMREAARWYDVEVDYSGKVPADRFTGKISRSANLSQWLKVLEYSDVHFKVEGRKITVMP